MALEPVIQATDELLFEGKVRMVQGFDLKLFKPIDEVRDFLTRNLAETQPFVESSSTALRNEDFLKLINNEPKVVLGFFREAFIPSDSSIFQIGAEHCGGHLPFNHL